MKQKYYNSLKNALLLVMLGMALPGFAQQPLSLEMCRQMALDHNQDVKQAQANKTISEASLKLSKRAKLPQFDLSAEYTYMNDPQVMSIPGFELPTTSGGASGVYYPGGNTNLTYHNNYNGGINFSLPLYMGGKLNHYETMAEFGAEMAQNNLDNTRENIVLSVDQQYWALVSLKESLLVVRKSVHLLEDIVREMDNRFKVGVVTQNEVLKVQVELNNARLQEIQLNNNIELAYMALNQTIGNSILTKISVADSVQLIDNREVNVANIDSSAANRNELQLLQKQVALTEVNEQLTKSDYLPQLVSFASYGFQNPNHLAQDETELTWVAGLNLSMPIFHWGERKLKVEQNRLSTQNAQWAYEKAKEGIVLQIQQSIFRVNESITKIAFTQASLQQAEENLQLEMNRLNQGIITSTEVLDAQVQWQKANADFIVAKVEYKISMSVYQKAIGTLL